MNFQQCLKQLNALDAGHKGQPNGAELAALIAKLQDTVGEDLPASYQAALPVIGGMGFTSVTYPTQEDVGNAQKSGSIQAFFGFTGEDDGYDLRTVMDNQEDLVSNGYLPIALDPGGNLICLDLDDGSVWFWDGETDELSLINQTFAGFMASLTIRDYERNTRHPNRLP